MLKNKSFYLVVWNKKLQQVDENPGATKLYVNAVGSASSVFNIRCQPLGTFPLPAEGPTAESKHWRLMFLGESGRVPNTLTSVCDGRRRW